MAWSIMRGRLTEKWPFPVNQARENPPRRGSQSGSERRAKARGKPGAEQIRTGDKGLESDTDGCEHAVARAVFRGLDVVIEAKGNSVLLQLNAYRAGEGEIVDD